MKPCENELSTLERLDPNELFRPPPEGWGKDKLSLFFALADYNSRASFVQLQAFHKQLVAIEDVFFAADALQSNEDELVTRLLISGAQSAFRGAARLAYSTQVAESYMVGRGCIESAAYAHLVHRVAGLDEVFLRRHDDGESLKKSKTEFKWATARGRLEEFSPQVSERAQGLYSHAIDYGGHPNERSLTQRIKEFPNGDSTKYEIGHLVGEPKAIVAAVRFTVAVGVLSLRIYELIRPVEFEEAGLTEAIRVLARDDNFEPTKQLQTAESLASGDTTEKGAD